LGNEASEWSAWAVKNIQQSTYDSTRWVIHECQRQKPVLLPIQVARTVSWQQATCLKVQQIGASNTFHYFWFEEETKL